MLRARGQAGAGRELVLEQLRLAIRLLLLGRDRLHSAVPSRRNEPAADELRRQWAGIRREGCATLPGVVDPDTTGIAVPIFGPQGPVPNEDRISPPAAAAFAVIMLCSTPAGDAYTFEDLQGMFANAGFSKTERMDVPHSPETLIVSS